MAITPKKDRDPLRKAAESGRDQQESFWLFRVLRARARTVIAVAAMVVVFFGTGMMPNTAARFLLAWNAGALLWIVLCVGVMFEADVQRMRRRAEEQDEGAVIILIVSCAAAIFTLVAIAFLLSGMEDKSNAEKIFHLALAGCTVLSSWFFVHLAFAFHYAHEYYRGDSRQGMLFPGPDNRPDYWDFAYFAANMGAASQTSDVQITSSRLRRLVLAHTILSFFFNTTILALGVNVAAGLL